MLVQSSMEKVNRQDTEHATALPRLTVVKLVLEILSAWKLATIIHIQSKRHYEDKVILSIHLLSMRFTNWNWILSLGTYNKYDTRLEIFRVNISGRFFIKFLSNSLSEKCPYLEFSWSIFFRTQSECGRIRTRKILNTDTFHTVFYDMKPHFHATYLIKKQEYYSHIPLSHRNIDKAWNISLVFLIIFEKFGVLY